MNWSGAEMRCPKCNKYLPDRCTCNGPSAEERRAAPIAAQLDQDAERAAFEAWTRKDIGMPDNVPFNWDSHWAKAALEGWLERARRAEPVVAQLDADNLPPLTDEEISSALSAIEAKAIAPYAERIRHLERNQLPKLDADDEVSFPNDTGLAVVRAERYDQLREAEERIRQMERELAAAKLAPMCERKTDHIIQRDGYEKTGYVLKKAGERICVSDGGAVAWFTLDEWNWLMFNRDHVEFNWPKPYGRTAGTAPVKFGCHCDLESHMEPDGCVIDANRREDCLYARKHATKEACEYWQPIKFAAAPSTQEGAKP